jgi:hypothetical protein
MGVRALLPVLAAAAVLSACGEDPGAAQRAWAKQADAACVRAVKEVTRLGPPQDLAELDDRADGAADAVRRAIADIRRLPEPDGAEARIDPFLRDLTAIERWTTELQGAAGGNDLGRLVEAAKAVGQAWPSWTDHAQAAGLRACAREHQETPAMDAMLAPAYLQEIVRIHEWLRSREAGQERPAPTARAWADALDREGRLYVEVTERLGALTPPVRASDAHFDLRSAASDASADLGLVADDLRDAERLTARLVANGDARLRRTARRLERAFRSVLRDAGARPTTVPAPEDEDPEEDPPADDEATLS